MSNLALPVLDAKQAKALMRRIFETETLDVAVFVDQGWGNSPLNITIIKDGDGQAPVASITPKVYEQLLADRSICGDNLNTHKARKNHQFRGTGWFKTSRTAMLGAATSYPALERRQKEAVRRAVRGFEKRGAPKRAKTEYSGSCILSTVDYPHADLRIVFGRQYGAPYVESIEPIHTADSAQN